MARGPDKLLVAMVLVGALGGFLALGLHEGGFLRTSDVGGLAELADVQARLRPFDICEIEYGRRDKWGRRGFSDAVFLKACSHGSYDDTVLRPTRNWLADGVGFRMERGGRDRVFRVLVEKSNVPFPALRRALEELVPVVEGGYDAALAEVRQRMADFDRAQQAKKAQEDARTKAAPGSYPK